MKRSGLDKNTLYPNFIGSWLIEPKLCDGIITSYEKNQPKLRQCITPTSKNLKTKDGSDIDLSPNELMLRENTFFKKYSKVLSECYRDYSNQWPFLASMVDHLDIGNFNIDKYLPGQHFQKTYCERTGLHTLHRLLAFKTYLNDVEHGGSTYFKHYDLDIQPKKGLTLIWPAEWTHTHKNNEIKSGSKYIITGSLTFPK